MEKMFGESRYFDQALDAPQTARNCPSLVPTMGSINNNSLQGSLKLSNFSPDEISNHNHSAMGIDLQGQLGFDLEQEYHSHMVQNMFQDSHPPAPLEHGNWEESRLHEIAPDMNLNHHLNQDQQKIALQCFNSSQYSNPAYALPDLHNFLHLPSSSSSISFNGPNENPIYYHTSFDNFDALPADPPLQLNLPPQPPIFRDLFNSLQHNYSLPCSRGGSYFGGIDDREANSVVFQEGENSVLHFRREMPGLGKGEMKGANHFTSTTEKQRREQFNEKYTKLRSLLPNPTKADRASIVGDAIDHIKELLRTVNELKILVDKKRGGRKRSKKNKVEGGAAADMESSSMKSLNTVTDREQSFNGSLRCSWLLRKSKETDVDVRIVDDEVTIKLKQRKKMNCLLLVAKILHELQLELLHVSGGNIGDYYVFMFNSKICEGSSIYAGAIAKRLIEVLDRQYPSFPASF
ncbi:transcription factor EAT1-like [Tasmannia lanceolata]|uniref:transcription factor EAT1-like n=1 Tax=Tasmannia lanceolata TaxID=3420 RepID=UPI004063B34B